MSTPAGWYDDGSGRQRWWDGQQWTDNFAPDAETQVPVDAPAEVPTDAPGEVPTDAPADAAVAGGDFDPDATALREDIQSMPSYAHLTPVENPTQAYPPSDYTAPGYAPPAAPGYADVNATASYPGAYQVPGAGQPYGAPYTAAESVGPKKTPVLGFVGLGLAVLGTILACIPVTFIFGAVVLFAAFVVSIIAIFQKNTAKWPSITGLILSIVGGIIGTVIITITALAVFESSIDELSSAPPFSDSESAAPQESDDPSTDEGDSGVSGEGRPSADEVAAGLDEIIAATGASGDLSDEQIMCYANYFVDSDIPDDTLWVIASGDETFTDAEAAGEFTEKFADGMTTCLMP